MNILLLAPNFPAETFWNMSQANRVLMGRPGYIPPLGLLTVASYLPADFNVRFIDRAIREETDEDWQWADAVFLSAMIVQREDYRTCVTAARRHGKPIAVGGPFTHAYPEEVIADADWVCFGEAEDSIDELVDDIRHDRRGKQYHGSNTVNLEHARVPRFDLLPDANEYTTIAIQYSRGCPFQCEFCDIIEIYGRVPRGKTPRQVIAELDALARTGFRGMVFLSDDNFIGNKKRAKSLLQEIAAWNRRHQYPYSFGTQVSINAGDDPELLDAMAQAGIQDVFIGIETPEPKLLKTTLKMQNLHRDPLERLRTIREHGIHVTAGFILGFDGETRDVFETQREFMRASGIGPVMIGLLQALPHTQLSRRLKSEGRLLDVRASSVNTTEGINFIPKGELSKRDYLDEYRRLVTTIYDPKEFFERSSIGLRQLGNRIPGRLQYRLLRSFYGVFLRQVWHLGIKAKGARRYFWKAFAQLMLRNPRALTGFALDCYFFFYLRRHVAYVDRYIADYLRSPDPHDVLDEVIPDDSMTRSPASPRPALPVPSTVAKG